MLIPLHHRYLFSVLISFIFSMELMSQAPTQYVITDVNYAYEIRLENVTNADDSKLPKALLYDFLGANAVFLATTQTLMITSRINKSRPEFVAMLAANDYTILEWKKQSQSKIEISDE